MPIKLRSIRQAVSHDSLFEALSEWCRNGAGETSHSIKILTAFASGLAVTALSPLFDIFLADGNSIEIIFGIDRNGTDRRAVSSLYSLQSAYPDQIAISVFQAPSYSAMFHPKLYTYETRSMVSFVIGSANFTTGGLGSNFESLIFYQDVPKESRLGREVRSIWGTYSKMKPPLSAQFLKTLTKKYAQKLVNTLPKRTIHEWNSSPNRIKKLWKPLSSIKLPRSGRAVSVVSSHQRLVRGRYLLMDILKETRKTQVQIPLQLVEQFFGIHRAKEVILSVRIWKDDGLSQPIRRPLVRSRGIEKRRLMRRLEIPQIKGLARPLVVLFVQLRERQNFAYKLLPRNTKQFLLANRFLDRYGQEGTGVRRFYLGKQGGSMWRSISQLLRPAVKQ